MLLSVNFPPGRPISIRSLIPRYQSRRGIANAPTPRRGRSKLAARNRAAESITERPPKLRCRVSLGKPRSTSQPLGIALPPRSPSGPPKLRCRVSLGTYHYTTPSERRCRDAESTTDAPEP